MRFKRRSKASYKIVLRPSDEAQGGERVAFKVSKKARIMLADAKKVNRPRSSTSSRRAQPGPYRRAV